MNAKVYVTRKQLQKIKGLTDDWDCNSRWLPRLDEYLWGEDIRPMEESRPDDPTSYRFLAGGVDHIDEIRDSVTLHDRGLQTSSGTADGTTRFLVSRK